MIAVGLAVFAAEQSTRISAALLRLQDTTAEVRVRGAFLLLAVFVVLAERLGLEAILGAFLAGAMATSRTALRLRAEREYPVAPLLVTADPDTLPDQGPGARLAGANTPARGDSGDGRPSPAQGPGLLMNDGR